VTIPTLIVNVLCTRIPDEAVMPYVKKFALKIEGNPDKSCSRHQITLW